MPLVKGFTEDSIGKNVKMEEEAGKPIRQAIAIALSVADKARERADKMPMKSKKKK